MEEMKSNALLGENIFIDRLPSGIKCYIIPKSGYVEKQAMLAVRYGSADSSYQIDGRRLEAPEGMAHFLEHKMFEDDKMAVFEQFTMQGASVNAFTTYTHTAYYFSCIDNFYENLGLLMDFVQKPHFTDANVEKEKGIIAQEIQMYSDNPSWKVYMNLNQALYHQGPLRDNIAGTLESIQEITKELLLENYNAFYHPSNMALICVGDLDPVKIFQTVNEGFMEKPARVAGRIFGEEPACAKMSYIEEKLSVSMPLFEFGFKETDFKSGLAGKIASSKILADIIAGESSPLYVSMYDEGLIDDSFAMDYLCGSFYGATIFSGASRDPIRVRGLLMAEISRLAQEGIDPSRFAAAKRKHLGKYIRSFNMIDHIGVNQVDLFSKDLDLFDLMDAFQSASIPDAQSRLNNHFLEESSALSVVSPMDPCLRAAAK
ncbi:MAG: insulinase family protein [Clostridiales bacterium]|jgi:predicted Zn-dependent peptidase|nr:insulinase family protein [Clostridiales bacterium]